jgi:low molecular weight phosphotyrosine protein phosphatase
MIIESFYSLFSPMAEAVFAHTVKEKGLESQFRIDSAGTAGYHVGEL